MITSSVQRSAAAPPTVSVVMPVYNCQAYVAQTIESILSQTYRDFELLILDDGSTDETHSVLALYAAKDTRIQLVTWENRGIVAARNELLARCRGRYMAANDSDDLSTPDRLEKQVAYLDSHPQCVIVGSRVVVMDPLGSPVHLTGQPLDNDAIQHELLGNGGGWAIVQSSMMCRTEAARAIGGYRGEHPVFSEDHDFYLRVTELGEAANLPEPLAWYRRHYSSTTRTYYLEKIKQHAATRERVLREAHDRRKLPFPLDWKFVPITAPARDEQARLWGWAALKHANVDAARTHARSAVRLAPFKPASWKLLIAALRRSIGTSGQSFPSAYRQSQPVMSMSTETTPAGRPPLISVLMSVYNGGAYLRPCIESVLSQSLGDFEFIIIDDGSKDDSAAVLRSYAERDSRIRLTVRPNKGLTKTLNECFAQARGEFLARMDCDDVCLKDRFERQVAFLRSKPDVVCVGGAFDLIDEEGRLLTRLRPPTQDAEIQTQTLRGHGAICHPSAMIRASALRAVDGYCEDFKTAQDLDLWLRLGEIGRLANLDTAVLQFRLHESSVSESKRVEQRESARRACKRAWQRRGITETFEAAEPWRPGKDRASRHRFALTYGWWAFNAGENKTARHYARRAIRTAPTKVSGWKLLAVATVKAAKPQRAAG